MNYCKDCSYWDRAKEKSLFLAEDNEEHMRAVKYLSKKGFGDCRNRQAFKMAEIIETKALFGCILFNKK